MQVLTPMTLYDGSGQSMTVYVPSTLGAAGDPLAPPGPPGAAPLPATLGIPTSAAWSTQAPPVVSLAPPLPGPVPPYGAPAAPIPHPGYALGPHPGPGLGPLLPPPAVLPAPPALLPVPVPMPVPMPVPAALPPAPVPYLPPPPAGYGVYAPPVAAAPVLLPVPALPPSVAAVPAVPVVHTPSIFAGYQQQSSSTGKNIYISNLPEMTTKHDLHDMFSPHGNVLSCRVARKEGQCPIGFVQYTTVDMAQTAVSAMNGMMMEDGRFIRVKMADHDKDKGVSSAPSPDLYVCNIPTDWSYGDLHTAFAPYGRIFSHTIFRDTASGNSLGSGMVRYSTINEAAAAIQGLHHLQTYDMNRPLEVKFAESRQDKDKRVLNRMRTVIPAPTSPPQPATSELPQETQDKASWAQYSWRQPDPALQPSEPFFKTGMAPISTGANPGPSFRPNGPAPVQDMAALREFSRLMNTATDPRPALANGSPSAGPGLVPFSQGENLSSGEVSSSAQGGRGRPLWQRV